MKFASVRNEREGIAIDAIGNADQTECCSVLFGAGELAWSRWYLQAGV